MTEVFKDSRTASKCALWFGGEIFDCFQGQESTFSPKFWVNVAENSLKKIQPFFKALHFHNNWVTPDAEQDRVGFLKISIGIKSK